MKGAGRRGRRRSDGRWRGGARYGALIAPEGVAKIERGLRTATAGGTSATYRLAVVSWVSHGDFAFGYEDVKSL